MTCAPPTDSSHRAHCGGAMHAEATLRSGRFGRAAAAARAEPPGAGK